MIRGTLVRWQVAGVIVTLVACASHGAAELARADPVTVGMSAERLGLMSARLGAFVESGQLAGIVTLVSRRGRVVHHHAQGRQDLTTGRAMQTDTIFRIYSMTKPVTAAAIMILFEEGKLQLTDPVARYLPEFSAMRVYQGEKRGKIITAAARTPITIHHLLTHTAGFTYSFQTNPVAALYRKAGIPFGPGRTGPRSLTELMAALAAQPLVSEPGTEWHYGMSIDVLGRVIEVVSGMTLGEFLRIRLFEPLQMTDTGFFVPAAKYDRLASIYITGPDGRLVPWENPANDFFREPPAVEFAGAGLLSTAADYLRFAQMLVNGGVLEGRRILGPRTVDLMLSHQLPPGVDSTADDPLNARAAPGRAWGVGFALGGSVVREPALLGLPVSPGTYGWAGGASTNFWIDRQLQLVGILMTQLIPNSRYPLRELMQATTYQAIVD